MQLVDGAVVNVAWNKITYGRFCFRTLYIDMCFFGKRSNSRCYYCNKMLALSGVMLSKYLSNKNQSHR